MLLHRASCELSCDWCLQGLNSTAAIALGSILHLDPNADLADAAVTVNGNERCTVNITDLPPGTTGAAIEASSGPQRMQSSNGQLLGVDGKFVRFLGVNYFGFDVSYPMLDGLWVRPRIPMPVSEIFESLEDCLQKKFQGKEAA